VHFDEVVERGLSAHRRKASDQRVALRRRESAQVTDAVVVAKAGQLLDDLGVQVADVDVLDPHRAQVLEAVEVAQDDRAHPVVIRV
jgi:hypothetical protein